MNVAVLAATGRPDTMKRYVKAALRNGATKSEIAEVLLQITGYCGGPCGIEAFQAAQDAFKELAESRFVTFCEDGARQTPVQINRPVKSECGRSFLLKEYSVLFGERVFLT